MTRPDDRKRIAAAVLALILGMTTLTGCASMRKKFTRVKKGPAKAEDFVPVLQPEVYEKVVESSAQVYRDHYAMEKVYFNDLGDILGRRDGSAKREQYMINQILAHFDGMIALLTGPARDKALALRARLVAALQIYDKPAGLRRYDLLTREMHNIERDLFRNFKPEAVVLR